MRRRRKRRDSGGRKRRNLPHFSVRSGERSSGTQLEEAARAEKMFAEKRAVTAEQSVRLGGMWFKLAVLVGIALIVLLA